MRDANWPVSNLKEGEKMLSKTFQNLILGLALIYGLMIGLNIYLEGLNLALFGHLTAFIGIASLGTVKRLQNGN
jgi:hypothetical protein